MPTQKSIKKNPPPIVQQPAAQLQGYAELLANLKQRIQSAQVKASLSVNRELVLLYWQIGNEILKRQAKEGWGAKIIEHLSIDLSKEFPEMRGFSPRNLKYMRQFAELNSSSQFVQQVAAQIPWFHHCVLMNKVETPKERTWYINATIEYDWSRNVLVHQIESELYKRNGWEESKEIVTLLPLNNINELCQKLLKSSTQKS